MNTIEKIKWYLVPLWTKLLMIHETIDTFQIAFGWLGNLLLINKHCNMYQYLALYQGYTNEVSTLSIKKIHSKVCYEHQML